MDKGEINGLCDLWEKLAQSQKPIVLYGMGNGADKILDECERKNITVSGVFASDDFARYQQYHGFTVQKFSDLQQTFGDMIVLVSFGTQRSEVLENIKRIAVECETFAPDVAVVGGGLFDKDYALSQIDKISRIFDLLCDDISRKTFECIIKYKITGDINYLFECESLNEPYKFGNDEIFVDLGAYTGDTAAEFYNSVSGNYRHIYAVEPDRKNFAKMQKNTADYHDFTAINAAVGEKSGKIHFQMNSGRNSAVSKVGDEIDCVCVDELCGNFATFIKADVEGQESAMIKGAAKTIANCRPTVKIAAYHRYNDILELPLQVLEINPDYKLYLRHKPYIPAWDTDYWFVNPQKERLL